MSQTNANYFMVNQDGTLQPLQAQSWLAAFEEVEQIEKGF